MSNYEEQIISLLKKAGYKFEREKHFSDLKKGKYRFDFCIDVDGGQVLLEVQGQQHYKFVPKFYRSRADFESAKERDRRKISYCLAHKIPLYIIPYWEIERLSSAEDLFQSYFRADTRWKNDIDWQRYKNLTKHFEI